jgi:hypothetical protein
MIDEPLNDRTCLGPVTEFVRRMQTERGAELAALARQFATTRDLACWIRRRPQMDDHGNPDEEPKVYACRPPQRLRVFWESPNCFERTVEYVLLAELIDAAPKRTMATVNTRFGRHTLPIENDQAVVLDPVMTRNELEGALFQLDRRPLYVTRNEALEWMATVAEDPAAARGEVHRVRNARAAMRAVMTGREITAQAIADIAYTVDEADREATRFGTRGRELHHRTAEELTNALITQRRRNAGVDLQLENLIQLGATVLQRELTQLGRSAATSASSVISGGTSGQTQLGKLGAGNPLLMELEKLIGKQGIKQGITLGGLAIGGPVGGAIGSLAGDALIASALRNRASHRNASWGAFKTPGVILDEINTTDTAVNGLGRDIADTFQEPLSVQQRAFLDQWNAFTAEWREFVASHTHWYDRMWRGSYDKAIEFREGVLKWRHRFEEMGGKPTAPAPIIPADDGKPHPESGPWRSILLVAGIGAAALILPEVIRTFRGRRAES